MSFLPYVGIPACLPQVGKPGQPAAIQSRTRRLEESVKHGQNGDTNDQEYAEFDGQFLLHLLDVAFQFIFGDLKFGPDYFKVGLDFVNVML